MEPRKDVREQRAVAQARIDENLRKAPPLSLEGQPGYRLPLEAPEDMEVTMSSEMGPRKIKDARVIKNKRGRITKRIPAEYEHHGGRDYATDARVPVVAPGDMYVLFASRDATDVHDDNSSQVGGGLVAKYNPKTGQVEERIVLAAHLSNVTVSEQQFVPAGGQLGISGQTGRTSLDDEDVTTTVHMSEYRRKDFKELLDPKDPIGDYIRQYNTNPDLTYRRAIGRGNFPEDYEAIKFEVNGLEYRPTKSVPGSVRFAAPVSVDRAEPVAPMPVSKAVTNEPQGVVVGS